MPNTIDKLLERAHEERASDLHLSLRDSSGLSN